MEIDFCLPWTKDSVYSFVVALDSMCVYIANKSDWNKLVVNFLKVPFILDLLFVLNISSTTTYHSTRQFKSFDYILFY